MAERAKHADCEKGKHLWLVNRLEPRRLESSERLHFTIYGSCALCAVKGKSDLLTREQLPLTEDFFTKLHPERRATTSPQATTASAATTND